VDDLEKKIFFPVPDLKSYPSAVQPAASLYAEYACPAPDIPLRLSQSFTFPLRPCRRKQLQYQNRIYQEILQNMILYIRNYKVKVKVRLSP
jgi:hypothetical protein